MKSKKAAMEMSVGTIVTIVLLMAVLILGLVFVKKIMCSGIVLTDQIDTKVQNEINNLFGEDEFGVICMGEKGDEVKLGDGGRRQIFCVINVKESTEYNLKVKEVKSLKGASTSTVQKWILDDGWKGSVSSGRDTKTVLLLDVPDDVDDTSLKIEVEEENLDTGTIDTHIMYIDITPVGGVSAAIC